MPTTASAAPWPSPTRGWLVVALLFLAAILAYTDRQVLSLLVDPIRADLGLSDADIALLMGPAFALVYGVAGVPLGFAADRVSRTRLLFAGILTWSIGTIACAFAPDFRSLFAARLIVGLGEAVLSPAAISLIADHFRPERRSLAVGVYFTGIAIGIGGAILIGAFAIDLVRAGLFDATPIAGLPHWRLVLLAVGLPGILFALLFLTLREPARQDDRQHSDTAAPQPLPRFVLGMAALFLAAATASLLDNAVGAWAPSLLIRNFGMDEADVGRQLGLGLMLGYGGGMLVGGWLADAAARRIGAQGKALVCLAAMLLTIPAALLLDAPSAATTLIGVPLYFALSAIVTASGLSAIVDAAPATQRGAATAIAFFLNVAIGAGIGPGLVVAVAQWQGGGLGPALTTTVIALYALAALALIAHLLQKRRHGGG
ncbi:MAG: MFS transporter [Sandarakinorhabdus sp.]